MAPRFAALWTRQRRAPTSIQAQSTQTVPAAPVHDMGVVGAKKARGIAGLFSDLLSQAQKNLVPKGGGAGNKSENDTHKNIDTPKNLELPHVLQKKKEFPEANSAKSVTRARDGGMEAAAGKVHSTPDHNRGGDGLADVGKPPDHGKPGASPAVHAVEASATHERRGSTHVENPTNPETGSERTADDRPRIKEKKNSAADEASAAAVAGASLAGKALPITANPSRAKSSSPGVDDDSSLEKKSERQVTEPKVSVLDLRRSTETRGMAASKSEAKTEDAAKDSIRETKSPVSDSGRELHRELTLDARYSGDTGGSSLPVKTDATSGQGRDFQSIMAERMRDAWNGEIVQSAHIVLKDGDVGIIRLRLRPESLGNVKIELNLSENNISGRIVVESDAAKNAFERNMNELADAFKQGGFGSAKLEVSVGGGSAGGAHAGGAGAGSSGEPFFSERLRGATGWTTDAAIAASAYSRRSGTIDILA